MGKTRILTISSDPKLVRFVKQNVIGYQYDLLFREETGNDLRSVIDQERPDLILLDIMMPNLDGIEVCLRVRQWSLVPIMMVSAWGAGDGRVRGLNLGAEGHLTEPFDGGTLIVRIREALQRTLAAAQVVIRPHTDSSHHILN